MCPAQGDVKKPVIKRGTPEGQFLELISLEYSPPKRLTLIEAFLGMFAGSEAAAWAYSELQDGYRRAGKLEKAIDMGEKLLSLDPDNLDAARLNWRMAETLKDAALIQKWTACSTKIAERVARSPIAGDGENGEEAQRRLALARQLVVSADYALYQKALAETDPRTKVELLDQIVQKNPQSEYRPQVELLYFLTYRQLGDAAKTLAAAEKLLERGEAREDAMLFVAEYNFRRKRDPKRVLALSNRALDLVATREKPEGLSDADWRRQKAQNSQLAHHMVASVHFEARQWAAADRAYRAVLSLTEEASQRASVLQSLGWANYRMRKPIEAIEFYKQCAAIQGPHQESAGKSIVAIKAEYGLP